MKKKRLELGVTTFAETLPNPKTGNVISQDLRLQQIIEEVKLAEKVGLDYYGVGEHHRKEFAASAPAVILSAAASVTKTIKLGSAVTVLSSDEPVRIYQQFATLNAISKGRAEITAGRGSFIESYPLFGYDLNDYDALFEEKLNLLLKIRDQEIVSHQGKHRPSMNQLGVYPRTQYPLMIARGVGGSPESVLNAAIAGIPLFLAIIGGQPIRFKPYVDLYLQRWQHKHPSFIAVHSHGFITENVTHLENELFDSMASVSYTKASLKASLQPDGALYAGTPEVVAKKIITFSKAMGIDRFTLHVSVGYMEHELVLQTIRLFGEKVKPIIDQAYRS
ncbi:MAG: LLM class flavin-dependent oxidoreductase [Firmicutes bacterium]|nr:LLM class flavin-dependent oxidoreductase [Bacillota bacterium]